MSDSEVRRVSHKEEVDSMVVFILSVIVITIAVGVLIRCLSSYYQQYCDQTDQPAAVIPMPSTLTPTPPERRRPCDELVLDTYNLRENSKEEVGGGCAICLEEYKYGQTLAMIKACNHKYHAACIKEWLLKSDTCPLCRTHAV